MASLPVFFISNVLKRDNDGVAVHCMKWGLVPGFTKKTDKPDFFKMFNARSESVAEKASFRRLLPKNRCLLAVDGFYEWKKEGSKKHPYYIHFKDGRSLVFAALFYSWQNSGGASTIGFWDIDACQIPDGLTAPDIGKSVGQALAKMGYSGGDLNFRLYGDTHVDRIGYPGGGYQFCGMPYCSIPEQIIVDVYGLALENRNSPLNLLLIMGDISKEGNIMKAFDILPVRNSFSILVSQPSEADSSLLSSATLLPSWEELVKTATANFEKKEFERKERSARIAAMFQEERARNEVTTDIFGEHF